MGTVFLSRTIFVRLKIVGAPCRDSFAATPPFPIKALRREAARSSSWRSSANRSTLFARRRACCDAIRAFSRTRQESRPFLPGTYLASVSLFVNPPFPSSSRNSESPPSCPRNSLSTQQQLISRPDSYLSRKLTCSVPSSLTGGIVTRSILSVFHSRERIPRVTVTSRGSRSNG
jgi:hypothetical protein